jgi:hypothetical protein
LHQRTIKKEVITGETKSPYGANTRNTKIKQWKMFLRGPYRDVIRWITGAGCSRVVTESVKRRHHRCNCDPADNEVTAEAEESSLLEAVTRERLMKNSKLKRLSV